VNFNSHSQIEGMHAFLSPSKYSWVNYNDDKLDQAYYAALAAQRGSEMHALAHDLIRLGVKLPDIPKTLNMYVNDAIGYRMKTEQTLFYSINCFGQADAIGFRNNRLRIHDLKTGINPSSEKQLEIYAALFCLEYRIKPFEIETELRLYQNDDIRVFPTDPDVIMHIMDKITTFDKRIRAIREEL
jgi:hypothetical protein